METILELEIPASAEYIAIARLVVSSIVSSRRNLPDDRIDDLKLAVSEACTNAIEAYGANRPDDRVKILVQDDDEKLQVNIASTSNAASASRLSGPSSTTWSSHRGRGGRRCA